MLLEYEFIFANGPLFSRQFPDHITDRTSFLQIAKYNNNHHGIIDNEFLEWALKKDISYEAVLWFVKDFSELAQPKTKLMVEALKVLNVSGKILIIADTKAAENQNLALAARNIPSFEPSIF